MSTAKINYVRVMYKHLYSTAEMFHMINRYFKYVWATVTSDINKRQCLEISSVFPTRFHKNITRGTAIYIL